MRKIVYYVATSLDGFISGPDEDIRGFVADGSGVAKYLNDLKSFDTVIMGRSTYEFGYKFGLKPGQLAYPHMRHHIFSSSLALPGADPRLHIHPLRLDEVKNIRNTPGTDIYLCGGGKFAGWLLDNDQIDILKIKLNPIVLGNGVKLFGDSKRDLQLELIDAVVFDHGLQIITYEVKGRINS